MTDRSFLRHRSRSSCAGRMQTVAWLTLDKAMPQDVLSKKL